MSGKHLRRYTDLPALIYLLNERKITLLDPASWDDKNDSHYLRLYKEKNNLKTVLALCFSQASETYHHWRVFANGSSGVCISFHRSNLLQAIQKQPGVRSDAVRYLKLTQIRNQVLAPKDLPFLKRWAFQHEEEFRVILESSSEKLSKIDVTIPLTCIDRITLSPWVHHDLSDHVKRILRSIQGCRDLKIVRSTLISNEEWKDLGEAAAGPK
jgi:Protein of unknown function (DUF2971)